MSYLMLGYVRHQYEACYSLVDVIQFLVVVVAGIIDGIGAESFVRDAVHFRQLLRIRL